MSLSNTLQIGTLGMLAQSTSMGIISDNIANTATVGYKANVARFSELVPNRGRSAVSYQPGGLKAHPTPLIDKAGLIQAVKSTTAAAISGNGFFIVTKDPAALRDKQPFFTRAGDFYPDLNGNMRNTAGYFLQGYPLNPDGTQPVADGLGNMVPVNLKIPPKAVATQLVEISANLNSAQPITNQSTVSTIGNDGLFDPTQPLIGKHPAVTVPGTINVRLGGVNVGTVQVDETTTLESLAKELSALKDVTATVSRDKKNLPVLSVKSDNPFSDIRLTDAGGSDFVAGLFGRADIIGDDDGDPATQDVAGAANGGTTYDLSATAGDMSSGVVKPDNTLNVDIYDETGARHKLKLNVKAVGYNRWAYEITVPDADPVQHKDGFISGGFMTFNQDGSLKDITDVAGQSVIARDKGSIQMRININWANGAGPSRIDYDFGTFGDVKVGMTQFNQGVRKNGTVNYNVNFISQDGSAAAKFEYAKISPDGMVIGVFSNAKDVPLYQLPIADFNSENKLDAINGNVYKQTEEAGEILLKKPGKNGAGRLIAQALEGANVQLNEEFSTMITTQRAYSAASKVVTTADSMYETLGRLK